MSQGLWSQIANRHQNRRQNVTTDNSNNTMLYNLLTNDKVKAQPQADSNANMGDGLSNIAKAAKTFGSAFGSGSNTSSSAIGAGIGDFINGGGSSGSAVSDAINGVGGSGSAIGDAINSNISGGEGGIFSNIGSVGGGSESSAASSAWGSAPWAMIAKVAKEGYNGISGHDDEEYSDVEEGIIYPLQGAAIGASYSGGNPWAAAGGALYGLGYSFKDDLGMKDSNFLTQMLFPIGMGDGGGLRVGGKSILDLG